MNTNFHIVQHVNGKERIESETDKCNHQWLEMF